MESNAFSLLKLKYNTFTKAQKRLADFVISDPNFVLNQSISEVAEACTVSEATISRFCKDLGFKGYQAFKLAIVKNLSKKENDEVRNDFISPQDSISIMTKRILDKNIEALTETNNMIREEDIRSAVDLMINANRILFFGVGSSFSVALEGYNKFMRITPKVGINYESHMQLVSASLFSENDVAIIISYSGATKEIIDIAKTVKNNGGKIICITRFMKSPLTTYSDISLFCSTNERLIHGYSLSMELTQIYLLDILYTQYFRETYIKSQKNKENSTTILLDKQY